MAERLALGIIPGVGWRASEIRAVAREAEGCGFEAIFSAEVNNDVLATTQLMGEATDTIKVGTWIANIYLRQSYTCAKSAALIADATGGRMILGLGISHQPVNRALGIDMPAPLDALRQYTSGVASWLRGEGPATHLPQQPSPYPVPIYLAALTSLPRFRAAIDAKLHALAGTPSVPATATPSLVAMLAGLPGEARQRFERLHARCVEMRTLALGVRGASGREAGSAEEIRTPGLDRLLWLFLRLLMSKHALDRFLTTMSSEEIKTRLEQVRKDLAAAQQAGDERIVRSLQDSIAMSELRLDNFERAQKNAQFVSIELDRIEGKIQALAEMAVNRQDPDLLSSQVDSAAESMRQTEKAVSELQHLTGLADELQDPPAILDADLRQVLRNDP